jgi:hypothetical protein
MKMETEISHTPSLRKLSYRYLITRYLQDLFANLIAVIVIVDFLSIFKLKM